MFDYDRPKIEPGVKWLLIAAVSVFVLQVLPVVGAYVTAYGALIPSRIVQHGEIWRLVSYAFLHDPQFFLHILFNMLILWMMGNELEQYWGARRFVVFYFLGAIGSALFSLINVLAWNTPIIGASGALFALMTLYAYYFPNRMILLFFVIPMTVRTAVLLLGGISLVLAFTTAGGFAHITHLGGIIVGLLYIKLYPWVHVRLVRYREQLSERAARSRREQQQRGQEHFETVIDPILKKISEHGMESLSAEERKTLDRASKRKSQHGGEAHILPGNFSGK
jgi:membrane associated rhomboid family serine protease